LYICFIKTKRKYEIGYKPSVYLVDCTLAYYQKKYHRQYKLAKTAKQRNKYLKKIDIKSIVMTLNETGEIPTKKMHQNDVKRIWSKTKKSGKLSDYFTKIINIKIISNHGKVVYDFDEFKN